MKRGVIAVAAAVSLIVTVGHAQNAKNTCIDDSERGQKLVDDRRLLEARNAFLSCAKESCPAAVVHDCQSRLDDLKKNIPSIVVRATAKDGSDVAGGTVTLDGVAVGQLDGRLIEVNPGAHDVGVALPDGRKLTQHVVLAAGDHARSVAFASDQPVVATASVEQPKTHWSTVRTVGFATLLVGIAAVTAGGVTLALAFVSNGDATTLQTRAINAGSSCPSLDASTYSGSPPASDCANAVADHQLALTDQTVAIVVGSIGLAAVVGGVLMFVVGGNAKAQSALHVTPFIGPRVAGLGLNASF